MVPYVFIGLFLLLCLAGGLWGTDSRPGFNGGSDERKERFFFHSKID
jgi:hypothetical protein